MVVDTIIIDIIMMIIILKKTNNKNRTILYKENINIEKKIKILEFPQLQCGNLWVIWKIF